MSVMVRAPGHHLIEVRMSDLIQALLRERAGYVARGLADRVAQVDAELARHGIVANATSGQGDEPVVPQRVPRSRR